MELLIPIIVILMPVGIVWVTMHFNSKNTSSKHDALVSVAQNAKDKETLEALMAKIDADEPTEGFFYWAWKAVKLVFVASIVVFVARCSFGDLTPNVNINGLADGDEFRIEVIEGEKGETVIIRKNGEDLIVVEGDKGEEHVKIHSEQIEEIVKSAIKGARAGAEAEVVVD